MLRHLLAAFAAVTTLLVFAAAPSALERTLVRLGDLEDRDSWTLSSTVTLRYYNVCTGWIWAWTLSDGKHRLGEVFDAPPGSMLASTVALTLDGAICGWGYTGTIAVHAVDSDDCPIEPPLRNYPFCIPWRDGWQTTLWSDLAVPSRFAVVISTGWFSFLPGWVASDHPGAGPTGPIACGSCFPLDRTTRSWVWGSASAPVCPPEPLFDGFCNAELLIDARVKLPTPIEEKSWGRLKLLYR